MKDIDAELAVLTESAWTATPSNYSSMRVLRFTSDGSGILTYGYGQTIYAIIKCRWTLPEAGVLDLEYLESPPYQRFQGFTPDQSNRARRLTYELIERVFEGVESIVARPFKYAWTLEFSASPYPEGLRFPYGVPQVFYGHSIQNSGKRLLRGDPP
jgi:hypothetical protein